jgi:hypothetical protein
MSERKPGRPPLNEDNPSVSVCVKLPSHQYDDIYEKAQRARISVPEVIRRRLDETRDDD